MLNSTIVKGFKLAYLERGTGPTVLLVHGFPMDQTLWDEQVAVLGNRYRVIVPDLPGFGQSDPVKPEELSITWMADALAGLLDELVIDEPIVLGGLSMGGYVVMDFMRRHADRVRRLALFDTRATVDPPEGIQSRRKTAELAMTQGIESIVEGMIPKLFSPVSLEQKPDLVERMRQRMLMTRAETIAAASLAMAERVDSTDLLAGLGIPTLIVVGEHDIPSPPDVMREMAESIVNSRFVQIPAAGHLTPLEQPELVNEALLDFLEAG